MMMMIAVNDNNNHYPCCHRRARYACLDMLQLMVPLSSQERGVRPWPKWGDLSTKDQQIRVQCGLNVSKCCVKHILWSYKSLIILKRFIL